MYFIVFDVLIKILEGLLTLDPNNRDITLLEVDMPFEGVPWRLFLKLMMGCHLSC